MLNTRTQYILFYILLLLATFLAGCRITNNEENELGECSINWSLKEYTQYYIDTSVSYMFPQISASDLKIWINSDKNATISFFSNVRHGYRYFVLLCIVGRISEEDNLQLQTKLSLIDAGIDTLIKDISNAPIPLSNEDAQALHDKWQQERQARIDIIPLEQELREKYLSAEYKEFISRYEDKEATKTMTFGVQLDWLSYDYILGHSITEIKNAINIVSKTGVDLIRLDIYHDWFLNKDKKTLVKICAAIEQIRENDKKLLIDVRGLADWGNSPVDIDTYTDGVLSAIEELIPLYKPEYVMIASEPYGWAGMRVSDSPSVDKWKSVFVVLAAKIKEIASTINLPDIKVIATLCDNAPLEMFKELQNIDDIDIIGLNPYWLRQFDDWITQDILPAFTFNGNKELWIGETWDDFGQYMDSLAEDYIRATVLYAQANNFGGYILYYGHNLHTRTQAFEPTPAFCIYAEHK